MVGTIFALPVNVMATETVPEGMVSYWRLDEGSGETAEDWADGNDGTLYPTPPGPIWTTGKVGNALRFDGLEDSVRIADSDDWAFGTGEFTFMAWINPNSYTGSYQAIFDQHQNTYNWMEWYLGPTGSITLGGRTDGNFWGFKNIDASDLSGWHHFTFTHHSGTDYRVYLDGVEVNPGPSSYGYNAGNYNAPAAIGSKSDLREFFNGLIDELSIWGRALSDTEIQGHYAGTSSDYTGLIGLWHLDEGSGRIASDSSGNNHDGTLIPILRNGPSWTTGQVGGALSFDGVDDSVRIADSDDWAFGTGEFTFMAWINPVSYTGSYQAIFDQHQNTYNWMEWYLGPTGSITLGGRTGGNFWGFKNIDGSSLSGWHHITFTHHSGTDYRVYLDGVEVNPGPSSYGYNAGNYNAPAAIGSKSDLREFFNGKIDELSIWGRALSEAEIQEHYVGISSDYNGIIGLWHMDEGLGGTASDSSGNNHDGTLIPKPIGPIWTNGIVGNALEFEGVDDYVNCGNEPNLDINGDLTVEAWIYPTTLTTHRPIVSKGETLLDRTQEYALFMFYDELHFRIGTAGKTSHYITLMEDDAIITPNEWHHVAATIEGSFGSLYLDGVLVDSEFGSGSRLVADNYDTHIGKYRNSPIGFEGSIDEVAIWSKALTPDDILLHYTNGLIGEGYTYIPPDQAIQNLFDDIQNEELPQGAETSLLGKLNAALEALGNGNEEAAINIINAFINAVSAQSGNKLTVEQADALIAAAQEILNSI
jgi:hypothetical protein